MKRLLAITAVTLAALCLLIYTSDYLTLRYRLVRNRNPFGSVTVRRYYQSVRRMARPNSCSTRRKTRLACTPCFLRAAACHAGI